MMDKSHMNAYPTLEIPDVNLIGFTSHRDQRGMLTELYRQSFDAMPPLVQWNLVRSEAGVLRGVHGHFRHWDYLIVIEGRATIGLKDLRVNSRACGASSMTELSGRNLQALIIPPGVAHGFYLQEASLHIYGVTSYWDKDDELGCRWDDPELEMDWPDPSPTISPRDAALPDFNEFRERLQHRLCA
jgi:dTDP-4-dehydrorhamnose 3,5-epimerase